MAPWLPALRTSANQQYLAATRAARERKGEYVKHIPTTGPEQWLVMWFQDMPENVNLTALELTVSTSGPVLYGHLTEFETKPQQYKKGTHQAAPFIGSIFIVRGITYQVRDVKSHHIGGVAIELNRDNCCTKPDPAFFEEIKELTCWQEPDCD